MSDTNKTIDFLRKVWDYTSEAAECFAIVALGKGARFRHYCVGEVGGYESLFRVIESDLEWFMKLNKRGYSVYYQVLPLARKPEKGRGSEREVKVGRWLWADLDYKEVVEEPAFEGCREGEDHALECYYSEGGKWVHVKRPPLSEVIKEVEEKLGVRPTIVVDSGAGYHLYLRLVYEIEAPRLKRFEERLIEVLGGDPQSKDLARILRLPGSINTRVNRFCRVIYEEPVEVDPETLEGMLEERVKERPPTLMQGGLRELGDSDLIKIKELLKEAYRPGQRQLMILYLTGWLAKARVSPVAATKLVKMIYEESGDNDPLKTRLSALVYSYKKAGIDVDQYAEAIEALTGVRPYGLEREIDERQVKGKSGLQEILENTLGEEEAITIIKEIEEILGVASPYRDSVIELLDYEKQLYAVANLRRLVLVRARLDNGRLKYKERVAVVAPTKVVVYDNPLGGVRKYEVVFEGATLKKPLVIGPAFIQDIADRLKAEGLVYHSRLIYDVLNAVVNAFIRKGRAEIREEIESPGFYLVDGRITVVGREVREVSKEELKEALLTLNKLAEWFSHAIDRFSLVIKWGLVSPFSYIYKQKGRWIPWLYLYGSSFTGKTTLGDIVLEIWGLSSRHRKTGANIDTPARFGYVVSLSTFPVVVNEPGNALGREDIIEMMKNAIENITARGRYTRGSYTESPALAPLLMTSNRVLPRDDALLRRLIILRFTYGERINPERANEFEKEVKPQLGKLRAIGYWVAKRVMENPELLDIDWRDLATKLLEEAYMEVGLEPPDWIKTEYENDEDIFEELKEAIRGYLIKRINEEFTRYVGRVVVEKPEMNGMEYLSRTELEFEERVRTVIEHRLLSWAIPRDDEVVFTSGLVRELKPIIGDIGGLKSIAELLGWEYGVAKNPATKKSVRGIRVSLRELVDFLS